VCLSNSFHPARPFLTQKSTYSIPTDCGVWGFWDFCNLWTFDRPRILRILLACLPIYTTLELVYDYRCLFSLSYFEPTPETPGHFKLCQVQWNRLFHSLPILFYRLPGVFQPQAKHIVIHKPCPNTRAPTISRRSSGNVLPFLISAIRMPFARFSIWISRKWVDLLRLLYLSRPIMQNPSGDFALQPNSFFPSKLHWEMVSQKPIVSHM
jgi:hypothetical protein